MRREHSNTFFPTEPRGIRNFERLTALKRNWDFSKRVLEGLRVALRDRLSGNVECVALAGSFGRLEGSTASDADFILVVKDTQAASLADDQAAIRDAIAKEGASPPNKSGVFASPRTKQELVDTVGSADEDVDLLSKRLLLLLESRPIYGDGEFLSLLHSVFEKYAGLLEGDHAKEFAFLLNDLIRYFRFICVNYQHNFWRENEKWAIRNLKLRHSRVLMYAGLLFVLGEASKHTDEEKMEIVWQALPLTPLERLAWVYDQNRDEAFFRVVGLYNVFTSRISDESVRRQLNAIDYADRYSVPEFAELKANSDAFVAELLRFVRARNGAWSERFFEYLIF
jgi:hypothetical protein